MSGSDAMTAVYSKLPQTAFKVIKEGNEVTLLLGIFI